MAPQTFREEHRRHVQGKRENKRREREDAVTSQRIGRSQRKEKPSMIRNAGLPVRAAAVKSP